jgi:hypothetical protein
MFIPSALYPDWGCTDREELENRDGEWGGGGGQLWIQEFGATVVGVGMSSNSFMVEPDKFQVP